MKHQRWFLLLILILLLVNLTYVLVIRFANVDELVRKKLSSFLATELKASVSIGSLDLTENLVTISSVKIHDDKNTYDVQVKKIYVSYNVLKFMYSGFQVTKAIDKISIYDPIISYTYSPNQINNKPKKDTKPIDISSYFNTLSVYNGTVVIHASDSTSAQVPAKWRIGETFKRIQITMNNKRKSNIFIQAATANNASIIGKIVLFKGKLQDGELSLENYQPQLIQVQKLEQLKINLGLTLSMKIPLKGDNSPAPKPVFHVSAGIHQLAAKVSGHRIDVRNMNVSGSDELLKIKPTPVTIDRSQLVLSGTVINVLDKNATFESDISLNRLVLADIEPSVSGELSGKITAKGPLTDPQVTLSARSNTIIYQKQAFNSVDISGHYTKKAIDFQLLNAIWQDTRMQGKGSYIPGDSIKFSLALNNLNTNPKLVKIDGSLHGSMDLKKGNSAQLRIDDLSVRKEEYLVEHLRGFGTLLNQDVAFQLVSDDQQIALEGAINLTHMDYDGQLILTQLPISQFLPEKFTINQKPLLDASIQVTGDRSVLKTQVSLHAMEYIKQYYDLNLTSSASMNLAVKKISLQIESLDGQLNKVPIHLSMFATGDLEGLSTKDLLLNDSLNAEGWVKWKPSLSYGLYVNGEDIDINGYLTYAAPFGTNSPYNGKVNVDLAYNLHADAGITGAVSIDSLNLSTELYPMNAMLLLSGSTDKIQIDSLTVGNTKSQILSGKGSLVKNNQLSMEVQLNQYQINDITPKDDFSGFVTAKIDFNMNIMGNQDQKEIKPSLAVDLYATKFKYGGLSGDSLLLKFTQFRDYLQVDTLIAYSANVANIHGNGSIGYNVINGKQTPDDRQIELTIDADIINLVEALSDRFIRGHGQGVVNLTVGMQEEGLSVKKGSITIPNGSFSVKSQNDIVKKVQIDAQILDNKLDLKLCRFYSGKGYINLRNEIKNDDKDFHIAMLNIGQLYLKTSNDGILVTVPEFSTPNTTVNAVIKGQHSDEAIITGPFDDLHLEAAVYLSNGSILYPPKTENLLQLINTAKEASNTVTVADPLPFTMDVLLRCDANIRYVTYPTNFLITSDSYIRLVYDGTEFTVPEALFKSEQGTLDMFGTTFDVGILEMNISSLSIKLSGTFYKKAADGSMITLTVSQLSQNDANFFHNLQLTLTSDNPQDKSNTQILAKLRYNRPLEDLSRSQQQSMLQDEALQLVGSNIGSSFINPYLSPFEGSIRKFLHVDFFNITPGFVENVVNEYVISSPSNPDLPEQNTNQTNQNDLRHVGSSILLNNLSVNMGKYVFRSIFIDYTGILQQSTNISNTTKIDLYHNTSLRVSLPWSLRMAYTFQVRPAREKNSHELFIQRTFRF